MADASIDIPGLDALLRKLDNIDDAARVLGPPMIESLSLLQDDLATYPRKAKGAFTQLATPRQKRAFWAGVRRGDIPFDPRTGYRRTGTTGRKWTTRAHQVHGGFEGRLGNNAPGARWVHGAQTQQRFHKASGWKRTDEVLEKRKSAIIRKFKAAIDRELNRI